MTNEPDPAPAAQAFDRIQRRRVANDTIDRIKDMLLAGELKADQRLPPERDLADSLGVSRPTLREAMRALIALNIVDSRHGEGTFISSLRPELLSEPVDFLLRISDRSPVSAWQTRRILAVGIAKLATAMRSGRDAEELTTLAARAAEMVAAKTPEELMTDLVGLDARFQRTLARSSGNQMLVTLHLSLNRQIDSDVQRFIQQPNAQVQLASSYAALAEAVAQGDAPAAERAMGTYIDRLSEA